MSSSPQRSSTTTEQQLAVTESPSRYQSRYNDRFFNSLTSSPPREPTLKNSPLQPSRLSEQKVFEGEKYSSFEIPNSDRGNWREASVKDEVEQVEISQVSLKASPSQANTSYRSPTSTQSSSIQKKMSSKASKQALTQEPTQQSRQNKLPRYMATTTSFHDKMHSKKEPSRKDNLLRPRTKGGITKRVGTNKIPRYQSTTNINAVEDIKNEMTPEDNYIPMAARIKLFEKGLGNASNKPASIVHNKYNPSRSNSPSQQQQQQQHKQKERVSTSPSVSTTRRRQVDSNDVPSFARPTSASAIKKREHPVTAKTDKKPFRFTTSEYTTFHEKLNLWKVKDKEASIQNQKNKGIKRKNMDNSPSTPNTKRKSN